MQVDVLVKVSAHDFFEVLLESLQTEIKEVVGKEVSYETLSKGYRYKKKSSNVKQNVKVHIKELKMDCSYMAIFSSNNQRIQIVYRFQPISDSSCEVHYEENLLDQKEKKDLFKRPEKRAKKMLHEVEAHILKGDIK